jgi:hypothetical protein
MRLGAVAVLTCCVLLALAAAPSLLGSTSRSAVTCQTSGWKIVLARYSTQPRAASLKRSATHYGFKNVSVLHVDTKIWQVELIGYPSHASVADSMREVNRVPVLKKLRPHTVHL